CGRRPAAWPPAWRPAAWPRRTRTGRGDIRRGTWVLFAPYSAAYSAAMRAGEFCAARHTVCGVAGMTTSSWPTASVMAVMTAAGGWGGGREEGGGAGGGARLAAALDAQRVRRAGRRRHGDLDRRQVEGVRHGVVHEARGDQLSGGLVVVRAFEQRLAHALGHA